jgi:hypothetical protein
MDPRLPPRHPDYTVSLSNIGRLLCNLYAKAVPPDRSVRGKRLLIERRAGGGRRRVVRAVTTGAGGPYAARVTLGRTERLRVVPIAHRRIFGTR